VPTTTVLGASDDCRFPTRVRLVPDADGVDEARVLASRLDDVTWSTNVRSDARRAVRFLFPLFEGTTIPSSCLPTEASRAQVGVLGNGHLRSKGIAVAGNRKSPETTENTGCRYVQCR
jgi:hypothetical protein